MKGPASVTSSHPGPTSTLRPLGLGEVLDRAVSLSIRAFVLLALIYLVLAIPRAIVQYFAFQSVAGMFTTLVHGVQTHADMTSLSDRLQRFQTSPWLSALGLLLSVVVLPLPIAALTIACATVYFGGTMTFNDAYRTALGRWFHLILLNVVWFAAAMIAMIVVFFVVLIVGVGLGALVALFKTAGIIIAAVAGFAALVFLFGVGLLFTLAWQLSVVACVIERSSFIEAFVSGSRRVLSGLGVRRALLVGLVFALIYGGLALAQTVGTSLLVLLVHQTIVGTIYATLLSVLTQVIATAFMVIFYFDLRVREDGLDLELAAARDQQSVVTA